MKQTYGIMGILGVFLLLLGATGVYAYSNGQDENWNMMKNTRATYQGMGNHHTSYNGLMGNGNHQNMMGNLDKEERDHMNALHNKMIKNLDRETAKQMEAMHNTCMGNTYEDLPENA